MKQDEQNTMDCLVRNYNKNNNLCLSIKILIMILDCLTGVYSNEGIPGLWRGTVASLLLVFNPSVQFTIYEALKRYYLALFNVEVHRLQLSYFNNKITSVCLCLFI